jgi:hypothetical protein
MSKLSIAKLGFVIAAAVSFLFSVSLWFFRQSGGGLVCRSVGALDPEFRDPDFGEAIQ